MKKLAIITTAICFNFIMASNSALATAISITNTAGAAAYVIGTPESVPFTLVGNGYNDNTLYVWDEVQNFTLTSDLYVDRVADANENYVGGSAGNYFLKAGTIVSSHYVQWDPSGTQNVEATLNFDSDIFAFITKDSKLSDSDFLGLAGINYGDFALRGLESGDITNFNGGSVDIHWTASNPGDWTRLITAESPSATVPEPTMLSLLFLGLTGIVYRRRRV